jgi:hypothetical protein
MDEEYTYIGYRIIDYIGYDEYESDREIIVGETNNLLFCIRNLHEQCKNDITEMNLCIESSYDISYYICVYKELFCGVSECIHVCTDYYGENVDDSEYDSDDTQLLETDIGYLFEIHKQYDNNIKKIVNSCKQADKKKNG